MKDIPMHQFLDYRLFTPTQFEKSSGIHMIRIGHNIAKASFCIGPRFITSYSLHFVLEGKGSFQQKGIRLELKKGDIFCIFPHQTHQYFTDPHQLLEMYWIDFSGKQSQSLLRLLGISSTSPHISNLVQQNNSAEIISIMERMIQKKDNGSIDRLSLIFELFYYLMSLRNQEIIEKKDEQSWFQKSIEYMEMHYTEGLTVEDVSSYIGVHRSHFARVFTRNMGLSPLQYLQSLKMKESVRLLTETSYSVTEIALSLGFPDLYAFSRSFKNHYGVSPSQYSKIN